MILVLDLFFLLTEHRPHGARDVPLIPRSDSTSEFMPVDAKEVEYFFASDASAVIEHTNRVIYLEVSLILNFYRFIVIHIVFKSISFDLKFL